MTLSNNAIKFLQAQYRAIFKRAYIKGLATAVLLTAGLAAGQAQAVDLTIGWESGDALETSTAEDTFIKDSATVGGIIINAGDKLTTSGSIISNGAMTSHGNLTIESGSILLAEKETVGDNANQTIYRYDFTSNGGDITMTGNIGAATFSISGGTLELNSGGAGDTNLTAYGFGWKQGDKDGTQSPAYYDRSKANGLLSGVKITVNKDTNVSALNLLTIENSTVNLSGSGDNLIVNSESGDLSSYLQGSKQIKISKTDITVNGNNNAIVSANGQINDSTIEVKSQAKLLITGAHSHGLAQYSLSKTNIINQGELILGETSDSGSDSFTFTGGSMNNTGTVIVNADELSVTDDYFAGFFNKGEEEAQGKLNFSGSAINVDGSVDLNGLGIISSGDGSLDSDRLGLKAEGATLTTDTVSLKGFYTADELDLDVGTLNVEGTEQGRDKKIRFEMDSGTTITVHEALTGSNKIEQFVIKATDAGDTTSLILDAGANGGKITNIENFHVGWDNSGSSELTVKGTWDFGGSVIKAGSGGTVTIDGTANNVGDLRLQEGGDTVVNGTMEIDRLLATTAGGSTLDINGTLTITGDGTTEQANSSGDYANDVQLTEATVNINNGGTLAITEADALDDFLTVTKNDSGAITGITVSASGDKTTDIGGWSGDKVNLNAGGTLQLNLAALGVDTISQNNLSSLKESLVASGSKGSFDFGDGLTINLDPALQDDIDSGEVSYGSLSSGGVNDVQGVADGVTVTVTDAEATKGIHLSNGASAVKLASGTTSVAVDGTLMLNSSTGGNFVYSANTDGTQTVAKVSVKANSGVNLTGAGTVGDLVKNGAVSGTSAVLTAGQGAIQNVEGEINLDAVTIGQGTVNVAKNVSTTTLTLDGNLTNAVDTTVSGNTAKSITAASLTQNGGTLITNNLTLGAGSSADSTTSELNGVVTADSITINQSKTTTAGGGNVINIINDSLVAAETFTAASGSVINVGTDGDGDSGTSSTGTLDVGTLNLKGATLTIDPIYGLDYAAAIVNNLSQNNTLDGSVNIGQNSVLAVGFEDRTELDQFLSENKLLGANGSLQAQYGSLLIVNDTMTVDQGYGVALDGTQTPITTAQNAITVDSGAAIVVTEDAFGGRDGNGELNGSYAIKFVNTAGTSSAAVGSLDFTSGGKVLLAGAFYADDFAGNDKQIAIAETSTGAAGTVTVTNGTNALESTNGVLKGSVNTSGVIENVTLDRTAFDQDITMASDPIKDLLFTAVEGTHVLDKTALGARFLNNVGNGTSQSHGQDAEAAARMATFGGAVQAGFMAQQTSTDAVAERLGMANPNSALITSSNAQGGGLWIAPVYKNQDSDEFDAQGVDYGADINLYGLALGADFTTESGVRVGALFNLGSGDADGQGVGSTVSNDFDYFGFTLYAGATFGNFALTADAGFTQLSNDLEQSTYMGTLKADTDTTVTSVGLRGEYLFATPMVDIVPHVGLRYTSLDLDSYDVQSEGGLLASTDADSLQVFSIPFGVTFSKDLSMGNWLVKPVFDLTLTANTGDDELDSTTTFTGMQSVALSTEIMDSFTYGATLGINAQYQESISFGLNVGYTGSSSADEFGVNANARYTF